MGKKSRYKRQRRAAEAAEHLRSATTICTVPKPYAEEALRTCQRWVRERHTADTKTANTKTSGGNATLFLARAEPTGAMLIAAKDLAAPRVRALQHYLRAHPKSAREWQVRVDIAPDDSLNDPDTKSRRVLSLGVLAIIRRFVLRARRTAR